ncbi:hypothetical protein B0H11DRAFT_2433675, partial [Mycena galericulata]
MRPDSEKRRAQDPHGGWPPSRIHKAFALGFSWQIYGLHHNLNRTELSTFNIILSLILGVWHRPYGADGIEGIGQPKLRWERICSLRFAEICVTLIDLGVWDRAYGADGIADGQEGSLNCARKERICCQCFRFAEICICDGAPSRLKWPYWRARCDCDCAAFASGRSLAPPFEFGIRKDLERTEIRGRLPFTAQASSWALRRVRVPPRVPRSYQDADPGRRTRTQTWPKSAPGINYYLRASESDPVALRQLSYAEWKLASFGHRLGGQLVFVGG